MTAVAVAIGQKHYWRRGIRQVPEPHYVKDIVMPLQRYAEMNTPLSRGYVPPGGWDEDYLRTMVPVMGQKGPVPRDEPGYTQIDLALRIAGFHNAVITNSHTGHWTRPPLSDQLGCSYDWDGYWGPENMGVPWTPNRYEVTDPARMTEIVQEAALLFGASLVGVTRINRNWVYQPGWKRYEHAEIDNDTALPPSVQYAVVMAIATPQELVAHAPTARASAAVGLGYSKMAFTAPSVAKFIAALGYKAIPCGNDTTLSIPLAIDAGLGQLGRMGLLITPEFGPRVRLCKVLTDLPLEPTLPIDFGIPEYCQVCQKCAEYCPAQAILYGEPTPAARTFSTNPGVRKWPIDGEACMRYWFRQGAMTDRGMYHIDCCQCVNVCPFNKQPGPMHTIGMWTVSRLRFTNRLLQKIDDTFFKPIYRTGVHVNPAALKRLKRRRHGPKQGGQPQNGPSE